MSSSIPDPRRWLALSLLCAVQFMVVLDVAIVNVALPSIQSSLHFTESDLQWVVNAYTLMFGGFLLLGGRAADLLGRRRVFMAGLVLFSVASLACGLATSDTFLIVARAVQGLGAAIVSPAALAILTTTFGEGAERNRALGIWGAIAGTGGAAGVLLGGILTDAINWSWIFFLNVPIGIAVIALAPRLLRESRVENVHGTYDVAGAITVTGSLVLLVYGLVKGNDYGWGSGRTLGVLGASAVLMALFLFIETRSRQPLIPLSIFRRPTISGANIVGLLLGSAVFSMFFFLSLYMQQVLGYSPLRTGVGYLVVAIAIVVSAGAAQAFVTRVGVGPVLAVGMALTALGLLWFTQVPYSGSYLVNLVPGFLLAGVGLGLSFVPVTIAAVSGVSHAEAGIASGLINTSQQVGGALGVALLLAVQINYSHGYATTHAPTADLAGRALVHGFSPAFGVGALLAFGGLVVTVLVLRGVRPEEPALEAEAELA